MDVAVQCQIISQMLVLKIIFQKSISYTYCIALRKKLLFWLLLLISMRHDLNENWKKGCIPKLECLGNVKLQSAASKRYSYSLSMHHPSNINWTILSTVRLIETLEEIYCTFKHKGQSWLQIIEVKLKKQRLETISINSWKRAFRLCSIKQVFTRTLSLGALNYRVLSKTKSANRCRIGINKNQYGAKKIYTNL